MTDHVQTFGIVSGITLAVMYVGSAIAKLVMYSKWSDEECPVETKLDSYLLVGGLVDIGWIICCIIAPCCGFDPKTVLVTTRTTLGGQTISTNERIEEREGCGTWLLVAAFACLVASFVYTILGNVWILDKYQHVNFNNATSSDYCFPPIFKGAFSMVIISDIWYAFFIFTLGILCCSK